MSDSKISKANAQDAVDYSKLRLPTSAYSASGYAYKINKIRKEIADHEARIAELRQTEKRLEKELRGKVTATLEGKTKKDQIITLFRSGVDVPEIIRTVDASPSYVSKIVSEYRSDNRISTTTRGAETRSKIIQGLQQGYTVREVASVVGVSPDYVRKVWKTYTGK